MSIESPRGGSERVNGIALAQEIAALDGAIEPGTGSGVGELTTTVIEGLLSFVRSFVEPLEEENAELLADDRRVYSEAGGYSNEVTDLFRQVRTAAAEAGYYAMLAPTEVGGGGLGNLANFLAWEALHHHYGPGKLLPYHAVGHWTSGPSFLLAGLHESIQNTIMAEVMGGQASVCFGMSEPDAGSDAWAMSTRAIRDGDEWIISGTKQWISNSPYAKYAFIFAVSDEEMRRQRSGGISCYLVPMDSEGFRIDSVIKLYGHIGGNEAILSLSDVRVPATHLVGELHQGFQLALGGVSLGRIYNAGRCVGLARWALEHACEHVRTRKAFGHALTDYQGVTFQLAESAMEIYAARSMALRCATLLDAGAPGIKELSIVKAYATEMCFGVFDRCMQVLGGMGLTNEMHFVDGWHQARTVRIADGTGEIMRRNIARRVLKGDLAF